MKSGLCKGQLTQWKDDRGFGFIQPVDGSQEIFLHISELKDATRRPKVGDTIYYYVVTEGTKVRASNAFILGAKGKPTSASLSNPTQTNKTLTDSFPIWEVLLLSILPLVGSIHFAWTKANPLPLILYPAMSLVTFALYAKDKSRAKRGEWRIPEGTLHLCEFAGGWLGGFIAQRILHHKNRKQSYQITFWLIVIIHSIVWLGWLFLGEEMIQWIG